MGLLFTDHVIDDMRSYITPVALAEVSRIDALFAEMEAKARAALAQNAGRRRPLRFERMLALCYPGQTFDMPVPIHGRSGAFTAKHLAATVERFHAAHEELHTYASRDQEPTLRGLRLKAVAVEEKPALPRAPRRAKTASRVGTRKAFFRGRFVATPIHDGPGLIAGQSIKGPAIIEEPFTTIVVYPGHRAIVDRFGNYIVTI